MAVLRLARSYWLDRSPTRSVPRYSVLRRTLGTDVVVLGGGMTGAVVAWALVSRGIAVTLVEAARVGRGSTAASTALLMQEPDEDFGALGARYGFAAAQRIWRLSRASIKALIDTIETLGVRCDLERCDSVYFTLSDADKLRHEHALRRKAGIDGRWLEGNQLRRVANIRARAAIRTGGNAQVDPYRASLGLLAAARDNGAVIFENSPVVRIQTAGNGIVVRTRHGSVHADHVVIATGYATEMFRRLEREFAMRHTYVLVTERLASAARRRLGLSDVMLWDTERPYHYVRWTPDRRLMLGGGDRPRVRGARRIRAFREGIDNVKQYFTDLCPPLRDVRFDYAWEGLFATTRDGLPFIGPHPRYPRHLFALGYGGNGMTFSFLAARMILEQLEGRTTADHALFAFER